MKALSLKQPWAWLVVEGMKDIENRKWATKYRGKILIHASKNWDAEGERWLYIKDCKGEIPMGGREIPMRHDPRIIYGAIIGSADILNCVVESKSPWFVGPYGFVLANASRVEEITFCKGRLGFFEVPSTILFQ